MENIAVIYLFTHENALNTWYCLTTCGRPSKYNRMLFATLKDGVFRYLRKTFLSPYIEQTVHSQSFTSTLIV